MGMAMIVLRHIYELFGTRGFLSKYLKEQVKINLKLNKYFNQIFQTDNDPERLHRFTKLTNMK